jgi:flagellar basal body rod protein FlgG
VLEAQIAALQSDLETELDNLANLSTAEFNRSEELGRDRFDMAHSRRAQAAGGGNGHAPHGQENLRKEVK